MKTKLELSIDALKEITLNSCEILNGHCSVCVASKALKAIQALPEEQVEISDEELETLTQIASMDWSEHHEAAKRDGYKMGYRASEMNSRVAKKAKVTPQLNLPSREEITDYISDSRLTGEMKVGMVEISRWLIEEIKRRNPAIVPK